MSNLPAAPLEQRFERGFKENYARAHALAMSLGSSHDDADDVVQRTFIHLWERWFDETDPAPFPADDDHFRAIVLRSVRHAAMDHMKGVTRYVAAITKAVRRYVRWVFGDLQDTAERLARVVEETAETLPAATRRVFFLKWRDGYMYTEIANMLDIQPGTVHWHLKKANRRIAQELDDYRPENDPRWEAAMIALHEDEPEA